MIRSWWQKLIKRPSRRCGGRGKKPRSSKSRFPLLLEQLDERLAPATHVWSGAVSALWSDAGNWAAGGSPIGDSNAALVFNGANLSGAASLTSQNDDPGGAGTPIASMTFAGTQSFSLTGLGINLSGDVTDNANSANQNINLAVALTGGVQHTFTIAGAEQLIQSGAISGALATDSLSKGGTGTLVFAVANSYAGPTTVDAGVLNIRDAASLGDTAQGTVVNANATLQLQGNGVTFASEPLTLNGTGFNNAGALEDLAGGSNTWAGNITLASNSALGVDGAGDTLTVSGVISDLGAGQNLTEVGPGTLLFSGSSINTYRGLTQINQGTLLLNRTAPSEVQAVTVTGSSGTFTLTFNGQTTGGLAFNATAAQVQASLSGLSTIGAGNVLVSSVVSLSGTTYTVTFTGALAKQNQPQITGTGSSGATVTVTTVQDGNPTPIAFTGNLTVGDGLPGNATAQWLQSNEAPTTSAITVNSDGTLDLNDQTQTVASLTVTDGSATTGAGTHGAQSGSLTVGSLSMTGGSVAVATAGADLILGGNVTATSDAVGQASISGSGQLSLGGTTRTFTVNGGTQSVDLAVAAIISGTGTEGLTKAGSGVLQLTAANTYTGTTSAQAGTLVVDGSITSAATVTSPGVLGGTGTITGTVSGTGTVAPGTSPGILNVVGNYGAVGELDAELDGTTVGTQYDQVNVTGGVDVTGTSLNLSLGFTPAAGNAFTIINNDLADPVKGHFSGLPQGKVFSVTTGAFTGKFQINYQGGDGNDVVLTAIDSANPSIAGTAGNDTFVVVRNGANVDLSLDGTVIFSQTFASLHSLQVNGLGGSDTLQVDLSGGNPIPVNGVTFNGGGQSGDALSITGGTDQGTTTYKYTNAHDGNVVMSNFGTVNYTGLTPLTNTGTATDIVFTLPAGTVGAQLQDDGTPGNNTVQLVSTNATFETTTFTVPTNSLTVTAGGGTDTITTSTDFSGDFNAGLTIKGTAATDIITLNALNLSAGAGALSVTGNAVNLNSSITTTNNQSYTANATLGAGITLTSTANGDISFNQKLDGNFNLSVKTGGTTTFGGAVGSTAALASLTTDMPGNTAINGGSVKTSGAQIYNDGVTLGATVVLTSTTSGGITFNNTLNGNNFSLTADAGTTGAITFGGVSSALADVTATGTSILQKAKLTSTGNVQFTASDVVAGNTNGNTITINGALDPATVTLTADDDITINAAINAANLMQIQAGSDGTGSAATNAGGTLTTTAAGSSIGIGAGATTGTIALGDTVNATNTGTTRLSTAGDITQAASAIITASALGAHSTGGDIVLDTATNAVATDFAAEADGASNLVRFHDSTGFATGQIPASGSFTAVTGITTSSGRVTLCADTGTITIGTTGVTGSGINTGVGDFVRIQATAGGVTQTAEGAILGSFLGVLATADVNLAAAANKSGFLAINTTGRVDYHDVGSVTISAIAALDCFTANAAGVTSNNNDINLGIGGDLLLNDAQPGIPSIGAGTAVARITAGGTVNQINAGDNVLAGSLGIRAGGNVTLCAGDNDVGTLAISTTGLVEYRDVNDVTLDSVGAPTPNGIGFTPTDGITSNAGDVNIETGTSLTANQQLNAGAGNVRLQIGTTVNQLTAGVITADQLGIQAGGDVTLRGAVNHVNTLAINPIGAAVIGAEFRDADALTIDQVAAGGNCGFTGADGIATNGGNVSLHAAATAAGTLTINRPINAGVGDVRIVSSTATPIAVTQAVAGTVLAADLAINAVGNVVLDAASNVIPGTFAANNTGTGAFIHFQDTSMTGFAVDSVAAFNGFGGATGVTTAGGGEVALTDSIATAALSINNVIAAAGGGRILLTLGNTISQTNAAGQAITGGSLGVSAGGSVSLAGPMATNAVGTLAAVTNGVLSYQNIQALTVGTVNGMPGIDTGGHDVTLATTLGMLTIGDGGGQGIMAMNAVADLEVQGAKENTNSTITSSMALLHGTQVGDFTLNQANAVGTLAAGVKGVLNYQNSQALTVGMVNGMPGINTNNHSVILKTGDQLTLNQSVDAGTNAGAVITTFAVTKNGVNQTAGAITSDQLLLMGANTGDFMLPMALNAVGMLAADVSGQVKLMDSTSLTVGHVTDMVGNDMPGIVTGNNDLTLETNNNFVINNDQLAVNQKSEVDAGTAPDPIVIKAGMAPTNPNVPIQVRVKGEINATAGAMILGSQMAGVGNSFTIRPGSGGSTTETLMGNANSNSPNCANQSLSLDVANTNITKVQFIKDPMNNPCNGTYEFNNGGNTDIDPMRAVTYSFFGSLATATAIRVTSVQTSNTNFQLSTDASFLGTAAKFVSLPPIPLAQTNPFIVSPVFASPTVPFSAPRVAVADVTGDGIPDIIIANGPGAPPLVEVIDGRAIVGGLPDAQAVISLFYAFDPGYMGGLNVAAGVLDSNSRASIVVGKDTVMTGSQAFGPPNEVRIFSPGSVLSQTSTNNPKQLVPTASFIAYPDSFLGGVRVAVGDVPGQNPIIVTAPGPGAALPVEVFNPHTLQATQSFFPYGTGFSDGVFASVANLQANVRTNDILTGPGSGIPLLEIFNGPVYSNTPNTSFTAFRSGTGTFLGDNNFVGAFNANTQIFGVSGVAFAEFSNGGTIRDILVGSGIGQNAVESTITLQQSDLYKQSTPSATQSLFASNPAPQGVNVASSQSPGTVPAGTKALPFSDNFGNTGGGLDNNNWTVVQPGAVAVDPAKNQAMGSGAFNLATVNNVGQADVDTQATVNNLAVGQSVGLVTRYVGPGYNNFYLGQLRNTGSGLQGAIFVDLGGTFYTLNIGATVPVGPGTLEFETVGSTLKLIYNNKLIASAMDTTLTAGSVGMRLSNGASVTSFSAANVVSNATLPFKDDFSTPGPASQLSPNWNDQFGNISINAGTPPNPYQAVGNQDTNLSTVIGINAADVTVQGDINLGVGQTVGLVARYAGPGYNNFYLAQVRVTAGGLQPAIFKYIDGTFSTINVGKTIPNGLGTLEFEVAGYSLKLIFKDKLNNQKLVAHGTDDSLTTGSVGMRLSNGAALTNFMANAAPNAALPFSDISAGDASQLNSNWADQLGNISINAANQAVGNEDTNLSTLNGINAANVTVQGAINVGSMQTVGLVARYDGPGYNNFYLAQLRDTGSGLQPAIFKNIGGTFSMVAVGAILPSAAGTLEFQALGNSLKLIFNGKLVAHGFDESLTAGSVGMRLSTGAALTSFSADNAATGTLPFSDNFTSPGHASQLSLQWSDRLGNISVNAANQAIGNESTNLSTVNGINAAVVTVQGDINLVAGSGQTVGLVARYGGPGYNNFYLAQLRDTGNGFQAAIFKNIGGNFTLISLGNVSSTGKGTLKFILNGTNLELDLDSTMLAMGADSSLTNGSVGMRLSANATLANFGAV